MKPMPKLALLLAAAFLASCGGKKEAGSTADITPEVLKFYAETKNEKGEPFFVTKTATDLPADLKWEDGSEQEEFGSPDAKKGGTYRFFLTDYPRTLRHIGPDANNEIRDYVQDTVLIKMLGRHPNTLEMFPGCAKEWARGADKKTFYFKLDPDAKFSDGEPVRADNFFFSFFYYRYPHNQATWYHDFFSKKYEQIIKYDDLTLAVVVASAKPDAIEYAGALQPTAIAFHKEMSPDYLQTYNWRFIPTTGAYEVRDGGLKKGQSVTFTRIKDWWAKDKKFYRQQYNPDRVVLEVIRDPEKAIEVFKKGDLDAYRLNLTERWHKSVADDDPMVAKGYLHKATFYNQVPRPTYGFWLNTAKPLLGNQDVREGLQHACNWDVVIQQIFYGDYERLNLAEEGFGEFTDTSIKARPFDPVKAAEFFAKAGFTQRGKDGIFADAKGQRLSFTITNSYKVLESALVVIKEEARKAGVEFNVETPENTAGWKKFNEKQHDIAFTAFNVSVEMYPRFWEMWHSVNAYTQEGKLAVDNNNFTSFNDKEMDAMIDTYDKSEDIAEMKELAWKMERRIHDAAVFIPGFKSPWYRTGHWRWMKFPALFDARTSRDHEENWLFWIDEDERKATQEAMKSGKTFEKSVKVYDQWRQK
ncbi:MAG TPA: ABC transporter substrate-binding protein [Verrucomicrobiales bacterium]|nr:ABC transporter substrate-binding protein [Verrucomicrobiales bacterium]